MFHFSGEGFIENGEIRFQLKATDHLSVVDGGQSISIKIEIRDIKLWIWDPYPFILVVYDAGSDRAFWLHIQEYVKENAIDERHEMITLRIPFGQKVTARTVDYFRRLSLENIDAIWRDKSSHEKPS